VRSARLRPADRALTDAPQSGSLGGIVCVVAGAVLIASKGIFAKFLYARGVHFETVVALRAVLAIPGFLLIAALGNGLRRARSANPRDWLLAACAGLVCYYVGATLNFYALTLIDATVERALLFTYPALVVLAGWLVSGLRPGRVTAVAVLLTYAGTALTVGAFDPALLRQNLHGAALVLICSATIAYYFMVSARLTQSMGSAAFTVVAMAAAGLALGLHYQLRHGWQTVALDGNGWALMIGLVIFATVLPLYLVAEGVRSVGAQRGAVASTVGPPATAIMAALMLGEILRPGQFAGMALIVGGILLLELRNKRGSLAAPGG
jgi:drug/metabolite transporter (DMT)-like permease